MHQYYERIHHNKINANSRITLGKVLYQWAHMVSFSILFYACYMYVTSIGAETWGWGVRLVLLLSYSIFYAMSRNADQTHSILSVEYIQSELQRTESYWRVSTRCCRANGHLLERHTSNLQRFSNICRFSYHGSVPKVNATSRSVLLCVAGLVSIFNCSLQNEMLKEPFLKKQNTAFNCLLRRPNYRCTCGIVHVVQWDCSPMDFCPWRWLSV